MLPMVVMAYLVAGAIYTPVASGRMFLYKDLDRATIINAKILALFGIYAVYVALQTVVTVALYILYIAASTTLPAHCCRPQVRTSLRMWPPSPASCAPVW